MFIIIIILLATSFGLKRPPSGQYMFIIIIILLATSFGLKRPPSGQYLQKIKMPVHMLQKLYYYYY
jgi:hypothetical protein